jgi:hypothetical protein
MIIMMNFQHVKFIFSQNFISLYFEDYLMTKLTLGQGNLLFVIMKFSQSVWDMKHTHTPHTHMGNLITTKKVNCKNGSQQKMVIRSHNYVT